MKKRIVFFCGSLMQGGAERVISILSKKFAEKEFDVSILCYYDFEIFYDIHPDVKVICVEKESGSHNKLKNLLRTRKFFKENADIVISFMASLNIFALIAHMGLKSPIIVADRSDPYTVPHNWFMRAFRDIIYNLADGIVLQTKRNFDYFSKSIQKKSKVIFNPIDLGEYRGMALKTSKEKRIVSVGRLIKSKNQKMLIEAFAQVSKTFPEYILTIYGDGESRQELEELIRKLQIKEKVFLPGSEKNIFEAIKNAELFVLPSNCEGMPNALLEAMCLGLPVISTDVSGAGDFIANGENGMLIDCGDLNRLIFSIEKMLSNRDLRVKCAQNATKIFEKVATENIVEQWLRFINILI